MLVASGNVLGNDTANADTPKAFVGWNSTATATYGTISLDAGGDYTYTLNNAAVQFLQEGETKTESYNYTMRDADGDEKTATLTITITGKDDGVTITDLTPSGEGGEATVSDANLADGSDPDTAALTKTGDFTISAPDGLASVKLDGTVVINSSGGIVNQPITTALGNTLTITAYDAATGKVSYSYTLTDNETHTKSTNDLSLFDNVTVTLTDEDNDVDTQTLSIQVLDDIARASDMNGTIGNDVGEKLINPLVYDLGADGLGNISFTAPTAKSNGETITLMSGGAALSYQVVDTNFDGLQEVYAYVSDVDTTPLWTQNNEGVYVQDSGDRLVFTLAPTSGSGGEGSYALTMNDLLDLPRPTLDFTIGSIDASSPASQKLINDAVDATFKVLASPLAGVGDKDGVLSVNANSDGFGIGDTQMDADVNKDGLDESMQLEFGSDFYIDPIDGLQKVVEGKEIDLNDVVLDVFNVGGKGDSFIWQAFKDGVEVSYSLSEAERTISKTTDSFTTPIHVDGGYDTLVITMKVGSFKIQGFSYREEGAPQDVLMQFNYTGSDSDGDTVSGSFDVTVTSGNEIIEQHLLNNQLNPNP